MAALLDEEWDLRTDGMEFVEVSEHGAYNAQCERAEQKRSDFARAANPFRVSAIVAERERQRRNFDRRVELETIRDRLRKIGVRMELREFAGHATVTAIENLRSEPVGDDAYDAFVLDGTPWPHGYGEAYRRLLFSRMKRNPGDVSHRAAYLRAAKRFTDDAATRRQHDGVGRQCLGAHYEQAIEREWDAYHGKAQQASKPVDATDPEPVIEFAEIADKPRRLSDVTKARIAALVTKAGR